MCEFCGDRSHHLFVTAGTDDTAAPAASSSLPTYSLDQIADYLTDGFWEDRDFRRHSYDVAPGGSLVVDLSDLNARGQATARQALEAWTAVTGIHFVEGRSGTDITFDDDQSGAWAQATSVSGNTTLSTHINIAADWYDLSPDYYLQSYIHEIGHALGLGHTGNYNGSATYAEDAHFANDSWQLSIMSYFAQWQNSTTDASYVFIASPQLADIVAVQNLYGTPTNVESGNTIYGDGETTGRFGMDLGEFAVTLFDSGGRDTINLASRSYNQNLDLRAEQFSDINGYRGNFAIARGVVIEDALTGSGQDTVTGNAANNLLNTGAGEDWITAGGGSDTLIGGSGNDTLSGGSGGDIFRYVALADAGDTITDFSVAAGDQLDVSNLLTSVGYRPASTGATPFSDGTLTLSSASGGAWLVLSIDGDQINLAFLAGLSAAADLETMVHVGDLPDPAPLPDPDPEPTPEPEPLPEQNTIYAFTDRFVTDWSPAASLIRDTDGGVDTLDLSAVTYDTRISLVNGTPSQIGLKTLTVGASSDIENLILGHGNDEGIGTEADNEIHGNAGNDHLSGAGGHDLLTGGAGNDTLLGGNGNDTLVATSGHDTLNAGGGNDQIRTEDGVQMILAGDGDDTIRAAHSVQTVALNDGNNHLFLSGSAVTATAGDGDNRVFASGSDLHLILGHGNNQIHTRGGNRGAETEETAASVRGLEGLTLTAGNGANVVRTHFGNDRIRLGDGGNSASVGQGHDTVIAGAGADSLWGGSGHDVLTAGGGDDHIWGGAGRDSLTGGSGADSFVFVCAEGVGDVITDFDLTDGDHLVLAELLDRLGTTSTAAITDGSLFLEETATGALLWFNDSETPDQSLLIADLRGLTGDATLSSDWIL